MSRTEWQKYRSNQGSLITEYMQGLFMKTTRCNDCHHTSRAFDGFTFLTVYIQESGAQTLQNALAQQYKPEHLSDYTCEQCKKKGNVEQKTDLCRLPPYLIIQLARFRQGGKVRTKIQFPIGSANILDMTPYCIPPDPATEAGIPNLDTGLKGPFKYNCYGIIKHIGSNIDSGHYVAIAQSEGENGKKSWHTFNDKVVTESTSSEMDSNEPYILFYKRQGVA